MWQSEKHLLPLFWISIRPFFEFLNLSGNSIYTFPDNELQIEILTYSASIDQIIQPNLSLIQLAILLETSWKELSRLDLGPIPVLIVELKQTGANSLSVLSLYLLNNTVSVIWYLNPFIYLNRFTLNKSLIPGIIKTNSFFFFIRFL